MRIHTKTMLVGLAVLSVLAAACGSDSATSSTTEGTAADATDPANEVPQRVVSLSPTHTEIMFAIGAGEALVAVDEFSNYPAEALELPNDLSGYEPNVEAIAGFEPDLVIIGGDFTGLGAQLEALGIEAWDGPAAATLSDTYAQIEQLGAITGHVGEAAELVLAMQTDMADIVATTPVPGEPLSFYHELDPTLFSIDSTTFLGEIYSMVGLVNVADQADGESFGYPQLNAEFLVSANPDLIFLADTKCCGETAESVAARDGWSDLAAVQNGNVVEMDDDIASRWGPRIVDYLEAVAVAVEQVPATS